MSDGFKSEETPNRCRGHGHLSHLTHASKPVRPLDSSSPSAITSLSLLGLGFRVYAETRELQGFSDVLVFEGSAPRKNPDPNLYPSFPPSLPPSCVSSPRSTMASSIASQLQAIKSVLRGAPDPIRRPRTRPSVIFDPKEAADIDLRTILPIALSGESFPRLS